MQRVAWYAKPALHRFARGRQPLDNHPELGYAGCMATISTPQQHQAHSAFTTCLICPPNPTIQQWAEMLWTLALIPMEESE